MKIVAINALSALRGGGQTYIINFLQNIPENSVKVLLIVNSKNKTIFEQYSSCDIEIYEAKEASKNILNRVFWEYFKLQTFLKNRKVDIYYAPGGIMITNMPKGILSATALRNMLPFDKQERSRFPLFSYIRFKLWILRYVFLVSYRKSDKIVFISEYSKLEVEKYIPNIANKSIVVPHGLNSLFLNATDNYVLPNNLEKNKFYLYVSILDVYKTQKEIVQAWKILSDKGFKYPLVLVGPKYNEYGEEVINMIEELDLNDKVIYLGKVDYEKLPSLYKSARALLFASSCECCPNILLEKLAAGKPTLCSNIEPMPEFGEDAVLYFDPYKPETLVKEIDLLENEFSQMEVLSKKATRQALKFNWENTIQKTIKFLCDTKEKENRVVQK